MAKVVGIDLGTTNSCVAFLDGDKPVVIPNSEGSRTTPSIVGFTAGGERLVGQLAKRQVLTNPEHTVFAVKRLIGRKKNDPEIQQHLRISSNQIVQADNGDARLRLRDRDYSPAEISGMILSKMKEVAEDYLGEPVTEAVITVPAYFDDAQRQATKDAGKIAGLEVLRIINEPTAAALAYGAEHVKDERIAVYDLGGGTFDISILELRGGVFEVRSTNGDTYLGGEDFDRRIIDWLAEQFQASNGVDLRQDKMALQRLKEAAERAKHELSSGLSTEVNLPFIATTPKGPVHLQATLTRGKLESLVEDLVQKTLGPCKTALDDAKLQVAQIDQVLLVGGQTRMPRVQQLVEEFFGKKPNKKVDPDEVVAVGAALQAGVLKGTVQEVLLLDVTPLSLGVQTAGGVFTKIIPKNTTVPTRRHQVFSTAVDNQPFVEVHVLQGEREMAADNKSLATFQLLGIPPAPRGVPQIQVTFDIDANGLVSVSAKDLGTGKEQTVRVVPTSGLTESEIQRMVTEAEGAKDADAKRREVAELKLQIEALLYTTERAVAEYGHVLGQMDRDALLGEVAAAKQALDSDAADSLRQIQGRLETAAQKIGEAVYAAAAGGEGEDN
ncbi:MAG TPA: molecular chaperone DnaK [Polyangia bacterium]|nr:molecular chaperone DnaK [Polyangia bacterium]